MNDPCDFANNNFNSSTFTLEDFKIFENCTFKRNSSNFGVLPDKKVERVFQLLLYFIAIIGNCLLLFVMFKDPLKRFRNSTSYFIINLALADLLSTASGITDTIIQLNPPDAKAGDIPLNQNLAVCFGGIGIQCYFLMILVFSLDRYMAIAHAYTYKNIVELKHVVVIVIIFPWCFAIITLPVMYFGSHTVDVHATLTKILAGNFIALLSVTLTVHPYTHLVFKRKIKDLRKSNSNHKQLLEENLKIAKVLATTVLVVSICPLIFGTPYFIAFCLHIAKCYKCFLNNSFQSFWRYYPLLSSIRVVVNSVVYAWRLPLYRKSLKAVLELYGIGNRLIAGNGIRNSHLHVNAMTLCKQSVEDNSAKSSKNESQSAASGETDNKTNQKAFTNDNALQPVVALSNTGYYQTDTYE